MIKELDEKAKKITDYIYAGYGSGTGWLFGISPDLRYAVETVVKLTLEKMAMEKKGGD